MKDIISIGGQTGGPHDGGIKSIKVDLYKILKKYCESTYCREIDQYAPVLRVDGTITKFGPEGITRLRFSRKKRYITVDIQIPEDVWQPKSKNELKLYLSEKLRDSIEVCVRRLKKDNLDVNETKLFSEIDAAIKEFNQIDYEGIG